MENLFLMMAPLFSSKLLLVLFFGTLFGLILGVLPGLGPTTGGALILPFTMTLDPSISNCFVNFDLLCGYLWWSNYCYFN